MSADVYQRLREQLDHYSIGYPATRSGVELKMLKKLFAPQEAEMFLDLSLLLETPEEAARRTGRDPRDTAGLLERMAERGLVFRRRKGQEVKYAAAPFVAGIYEYQLGTLDLELARLFEDYFHEAFHQSTAVSFMRPIPVNRSVDVSYPVATYEDSRRIVRNQKLIAVADCICRKQQGLLNQACDKPLEVCLIFGSHAQYYLDRKMARQVSVEEAMTILDRAEAAGLVTQPYNAQNPGGLCNCCGDCCGILRALNRLPNPAESVVSNYYAVVEAESCTACETCLGRCQMAAIKINADGVAEVDLLRCLGCGLCVTTCPSGAMRLEIKPLEKRRLPPADGARQMAELAEKRGRSLIPISQSR
ncbi:MAG: 4Fe-4S dicluster domain-containing protein [Thermodesulfobacteriota bacterium]